MNILSEFGIEPILLLAQIVNFAILLFLFKRFLYKPLLKVLEERKKKIETSIKQSTEIQKKYDEANEKSTQILNKTQEEAASIIKQAKDQAKNTQEQIQQEAADQAVQTLERTRQIVAMEKEKMISDAKKELASLVAQTTEQLLPKILSKTDKDKLVKTAEKEIEN